MLRIAVYDDNVSRRESLHALISLSQNMECVGTYGNCANILKNVATDKPDLILMDIEMPIVNGLEGVVIVKENFPHIKIIIQTAFDDDDKILTALRYGAEGYILKNASVLQISQSIDEVMAGGASMSPSIALKVMRFFSSKESEKRDLNLSERELEVLKNLSKGDSYKMIADVLGISYFTVNSHIRKIYEKLQVHSMGEAISMVHKLKLFDTD